MEARAIAKTLRVSPIKARLVVDLIRGKKAQDAQVILNNMFPNAAYMTTYENIGHETINLFRANDGYYYIHLNPNGTCNLDNVDVLNLSKIGNGLWRVMSKAVNCKRLDRIY